MQLPEDAVSASVCALDTGYVRQWIVEMLGEDDARVQRWDRIVRDYGRPEG